MACNICPYVVACRAFWSPMLLQILVWCKKVRASSKVWTDGGSIAIRRTAAGTIFFQNDSEAGGDGGGGVAIVLPVAADFVQFLLGIPLTLLLLLYVALLYILLLFSLLSLVLVLLDSIKSCSWQSLLGNRGAGCLGNRER